MFRSLHWPTDFIAAVSLTLVVIGGGLWLIDGRNAEEPIPATETLEVLPLDHDASLISLVSFTQDIDHFSNDSRAMSPRAWGDFHSANDEPELPPVAFGAESNYDNTIANDRAADPTSKPDFRQVENSRTRQPGKFFETQPLAPGQRQTDDPQLESPLPNSRDSSDEDSVIETNAPHSPIDKNELWPADGEKPPAESMPLEFEGTEYGRHLADESADSIELIFSTPRDGSDCQSWQGFSIETGPTKRTKRHPFKRKKRQAEQPFNDDRPDTQICGVGPPQFNPHLGHRYPDAIQRTTIGSSTQKFSFEENGEFPPASEILAQSVIFAEAEFMFLQPSFQNNNGLTVTGPSATFADPFNFDLEPAFRVMAGFESDYGPGFATEYFQFDNNSDLLNFTSDGATIGQTRVFLSGPDQWTSLMANDLGESLDVRHSLEVHSTSVYAFKAIKFKRAYVNGRFGLQLVSIDHFLDANLADQTNSVIGSLAHRSNFNGFGPRFGIDYVRKIGHTPAQLVVGATSSLLFGDRDQIVENTTDAGFTELGSDELVTLIDIFMGIQGKRIRGEKRNVAFRFGFVNQSWIGGGSAVDPSGDFGFQGISLMLGLNR